MKNYSKKLNMTICQFFKSKMVCPVQTCMLTYSNLVMTERFFTKLKAKENKQRILYMNVDQIHMEPPLKRSVTKNKNWTICSHLRM